MKKLNNTKYFKNNKRNFEQMSNNAVITSMCVPNKLYLKNIRLNMAVFITKNE